MLIKFKSPDPRAGTVAQMDSSLGQQFIDASAATQVAESEQIAPVATESAHVKPVVKKAR